MDDNQEYDLLLRSIFNNCDIAGTGLLSPEEFQQLCTQLQLEVKMCKHIYQLSSVHTHIVERIAI